jgi:hypothetical protein
MGTLTLPADFRAKPNIYGRDTTELFFTQSGNYRLYLGENLESDFNPRSVACQIRFIAEKR